MGGAQPVQTPGTVPHGIGGACDGRHRTTGWLTVAGTGGPFRGTDRTRRCTIGALSQRPIWRIFVAMTTTPSAEAAAVASYHRDREAVLAETQARHAPPVPPNTDVALLASVGGSQTIERALLAELAAMHSLDPPGAEQRQATIVTPDWTLSWERHTEFSRYSLVRPASDPPPEHLFDPLPRTWVDRLPGQWLVLVLVRCRPENDGSDRPTPDASGEGVAMSNINEGMALAWSGFRAEAGGEVVFEVRDDGLPDPRRGRLVRRLLDIETYRLMALLAFPVARRAWPKIDLIDRSLGDLLATLSTQQEEERDDEASLASLMKLAGELESLRAEVTYRFGAARAYYALVRQRLEELRETREDGFQRFGPYLLRRLAPAMDTCETANRRIEELGERVNRAGDLLRTRVDIALEKQNRSLLQSMDRRATMQLRLQQAVEGLSVVAISYYLTGLVKYLLDALDSGGVMPVDPRIATGFVMPVLIVLIVIGLRRIRKALDDRLDG